TETERGTAQSVAGPLREKPEASQRYQLGQGPGKTRSESRKTLVAQRDGRDRWRTGRRWTGERRIHFLRLFRGDSQGARQRLLRPRRLGIAQGTSTKNNCHGYGHRDGYRASDRKRIHGAAEVRGLRHEDVELGENSR